MYIVFLLVFSLVSWTEQHLTYPVNYCNMATTCVHDNRPVCASTPNGCSRRTFLDQCDMYEYNCDYNTRYHETYTLYCMASNVEPTMSDTTSKPVIAIMNTPEDVTLIEENAIEATIPLSIPVSTTCVSNSPTTKSYNCPCLFTKSSTISFTTSSKTVRSLLPSTKTRKETITTPFITTSSSTTKTSNTRPISTKLTTTRNQLITKPSLRTTVQIINEIITTIIAGTNATKSLPSNKTDVKVKSKSLSKLILPLTISIQPTTTKTTAIKALSTTTSISESTISKNPKMSHEFTGCCEKPKTWETTKEDVQTKIIHYDEDNSLFPDHYQTVTSIDNSDNPRSIRIPVISSPLRTIKMTAKISPAVYSSRSISKTENKTKLMPRVVSTTTTPTTTSLKLSTPTKLFHAFTGCCQRPTTWETTKEDLKTYTYGSASKLVKLLIPKTVLSHNTEYITKSLPMVMFVTSSPSIATKIRSTTKPESLIATKINRLVNIIYRATNPVTIVTKNIRIKNFTSTILQTTSMPTKKPLKATICIHCQRPKTWLTTTEKDLLYSFIITSKSISNTNSQNFSTPSSTVKSTAKLTIATIKNDKTNVTTVLADPEEKSTTQEKNTKYIPNTVDSEEDVQQLTSVSVYSSNETSAEPITKSTRKESIIKLNMNSNKTTWWYPTPCRSTNCQRPVTWLTTHRKTKRHRKF